MSIVNDSRIKEVQKILIALQLPSAIFLLLIVKSTYAITMKKSNKIFVNG